MNQLQLLSVLYNSPDKSTSSDNLSDGRQSSDSSSNTTPDISCISSPSRLCQNVTPFSSPAPRAVISSQNVPIPSCQPLELSMPCQTSPKTAMLDQLLTINSASISSQNVSTPSCQASKLSMSCQGPTQSTYRSDLILPSASIGAAISTSSCYCTAPSSTVVPSPCAAISLVSSKTSLTTVKRTSYICSARNSPSISSPSRISNLCIVTPFNADEKPSTHKVPSSVLRTSSTIVPHTSASQLPVYQASR